MTPKTEHAMQCGPSVLQRRVGSQLQPVSCPVGHYETTDKTQVKMTLCGSEVPQDRWRGRTAGSGMWTLTRDNLLSWSLDDPAIPYGL